MGDKRSGAFGRIGQSLDLLLTISFASFSSVWYWILTGLTWSITCHRTLGVPYDALVAAHQEGGQAAKDAEEMAHIYVRRVVPMFRKSGPYILAVVCFFLAVLATFGFYYRYELARAAFALLFPLSIVNALGIRLAMRIEREAMTGAQLRAALTKRRFWNQVIGLCAIFAASIMTIFTLSRYMAAF